MNRQEVDQEIKKRNEVAENKFCPLTKEHCTIKCVCFREAQIIPFDYSPNEILSVVGGYCGCYMIMGDIT